MTREAKRACLEILGNDAYLRHVLKDGTDGSHAFVSVELVVFQVDHFQL